VRRPEPFSPAWYLLQVVVVALAVGVTVGLDALTGGWDTASWGGPAFMAVVIIGANIAIARSQRRQQRHGPGPRIS
jgi:hypothetical protein